MPETRMCDACSMEFDWPGVDAQGYHYCCEACSRGEECTCPQHDHSRVADPQPAEFVAAPPGNSP